MLHYNRDATSFYLIHWISVFDTPQVMPRHLDLLILHYIVCFLKLEPIYSPSYSIVIFTHLKLCRADAIHNFKRVEITQILKNVV